MNRAATITALLALVAVMVLMATEPPLWVLAIAAAIAWCVVWVTYRLESRPRYRRGEQ